MPQLSYAGNVLVISAGSAANQAPRVRGRRSSVSAFTPASRLRLFKLFNRVDWLKCGRVTFLTLTYGSNWPSMSLSKRHLDTFLKRVRRAMPNSAVIWRLEFQERGAPHYHLLILNAPFWPKADIQQAWGDVVGAEYWASDGKLPFTRVEAVRSFKQAAHYISKYIGKVKRDAGGCLVGLTLLHISPPFVGRFWGVSNRCCLPLLDYVVVWVSWDDVISLRSYLRSIGRRLFNEFGLSFTMFIDAAAVLTDWAAVSGLCVVDV